jgi:hypothetical protein
MQPQCNLLFSRYHVSKHMLLVLVSWHWPLCFRHRQLDFVPKANKRVKIRDFKFDLYNAADFVFFLTLDRKKILRELI